MLAAHQAVPCIAMEMADETGLGPRGLSRSRSLRRSSVMKPLRSTLNIVVNGRDYCLRIESILRDPRTMHQPYKTVLEDIAMTVQNNNITNRRHACHFYNYETNAFNFFGRNITVFEAILCYHWSGRLHMSKNICTTEFYMELEFWKAPRSYNQVTAGENAPGFRSHGRNMSTVGEEVESMRVSTSHSYDASSEDREDSLLDSTERMSRRKSKVENMTNPVVDIDLSMFDGVPLARERREIWKCMEDHTSSWAAKIFAVGSVGVALLSILIMIVGSLPDYQEPDLLKHTSEPIQLLKTMELCCIIWFTFEFMIRFLVTPQRCVYMKGGLQIVDLLTILPSYMELVFEYTGLDFDRLGSIKGAFLALRLLRVLRVMRVFRLARYHTGLKQLGETLHASKREIGVLMVFFSSTVLLFATSVYYLEKDVEGTEFISIPAACWWCVITITTVGYGDLVPRTAGGQLVATVACLAGIIVLAFPITMIIENFNTRYKGDDEANEDSPQRTVRCKF